MKPDQQRLEITRPMWTVIAVVMGAGVAGKLSEPDPSELVMRRSVSAYISQDLTVERYTNKPVEFPRLGLMVTPGGDWSCLTVAGTESSHQHTFVNETCGLILRLNRFPFARSYPFGSSKLGPSRSPGQAADATDATAGADGREDSDVRLVASSVVHDRWTSIRVDEYRHVSIEWIRMAGETKPGWSNRMLGRIGTDTTTGWLTVIHLSRQTAQQDAAVQSLCDRIEPIAER